jgi:hypothetical protein
VQLSLRSIGALLCIASSAGVALAGPPGSYCPCPTPGTGNVAPWQLGTPVPQGADGSGAGTGPGAIGNGPSTDAFAQAPPAGGETAASAVPNMIGDLFGGVRAYTPIIANIANANGVIQPTQISRSAAVPQGIIPGVTSFTVDLFVNGTRIPAGQTLSGAQVAALQANSRLPAGGSSILPLLKIVENESPAPQDRIYTSYNYYNDVDRRLNPAPSQENVHRELVGFEKTFLNGDASIGFRLPFYELYGDDIGNRAVVGDLNIIFKYAAYNNRETGNIASVGLVVTAPTGADLQPAGIGAPNIHPTLFQPYVSGIYKLSKELYIQGFSSIDVPTDDRDVTLLSNDIGVGYFLYRDCSGDRLITAVVPTVELHVNTPLNHRGALSEPVGASDLVDMTFGASFGIGRDSYLTLAAGLPLTGPQPFSIEAQVLFNWRF